MLTLKHSKMKITKYIIGCAALLPLLASCTDEDYKVYDTTQKDSVFFEYVNEKNQPDSTVNYTFGYDIANTHVIELPVTLMGMPVDRDRKIEIVPVKDETTMVEGTHYTITDNIIPAGAVSGVVKINLLRDNDPLLQEQSFTLRLTVGENDDLKSVGNNAFIVTYSDIRPTVRPSWWTTYSYMPVYSFENAQLFFDYFYRYAPQASISIYEEMINRYDHYFAKASSSQGPLAMYDAFLRNYVCIPLADEHPEVQWQNDPHW